MDARELQDQITVEQMKVLLTALGAQQFIDYTDRPEKRHALITNTICHNISDGTLKLYYYSKSKTFYCYTSCGDIGNIFDVVMSSHKLRGVTLTFPESIAWICNKLGIDNAPTKRQPGFKIEVRPNEELANMRRFQKKEEPKIELVEHKESIFKMFSNYHHPSFTGDGISHDAMNKFEIMYDYSNHKVIVPHRKYDNGALIGIKSRSLNEWEIEAGFKYIPLTEHNILYSYPTYANLYGYWQNKENIRRVKKAILVEAEKSVLQLETFDPENNIGLALSSSNLSEFQVKLILELGVEEVILALDKENTDLLDEVSIEYQEKLLEKARMLAPYVKVTVIYDSNGLLEQKDSPTDRGKEVFNLLYQNRKEVYLIDRVDSK